MRLVSRQQEARPLTFPANEATSVRTGCHPSEGGWWGIGDPGRRVTLREHQRHLVQVAYSRLSLREHSARRTEREASPYGRLGATSTSGEKGSNAWDASFW